MKTPAQQLASSFPNLSQMCWHHTQSNDAPKIRYNMTVMNEYQTNINAPPLYFKCNPFIDYIYLPTKNKERALQASRPRDVSIKAHIDDIPNNVTASEFKKILKRLPDYSHPFLDEELLKGLFNECKNGSLCDKNADVLINKAKSLLDNENTPSTDRWAVLPIPFAISLKDTFSTAGFKLFEMPKYIFEQQEEKDQLQFFFGDKYAIDLNIEIEDRVLCGADISTLKHTYAIYIKSKLDINKPKSIGFGYITTS